MANRSAFGWSWSWGPLAILLGALLIVVYSHLLAAGNRTTLAQQQVSNAQRQLQTALADNRSLRWAAELIAAPDTESAAVRAQAPAAQGRIFLNADRGAVLMASSLPPAGSGHLYEMWLLPPKGSPVPAGLFQSSPSGEVIHSYPHKLEGIIGLAISVEPTAGSQQPTGPIVLAAKLPAPPPAAPHN